MSEVDLVLDEAGVFWVKAPEPLGGKWHRQCGQPEYDNLESLVRDRGSVQVVHLGDFIRPANYCGATA